MEKKESRENKSKEKRQTRGWISLELESHTVNTTHELHGEKLIVSDLVMWLDIHYTVFHVTVWTEGQSTGVDLPSSDWTEVLHHHTPAIHKESSNDDR